MRNKAKFSMVEIIVHDYIGTLDLPPMRGMSVAHYRAVSAVMNGEQPSYWDRAGAQKWLRWPQGSHNPAVLRDGAEEQWQKQNHKAIAEWQARQIAVAGGRKRADKGG